MYCIRCQNDVADCTCPDIEERLRSIQTHVAQMTCTACAQHVDRCLCYLQGERPAAKMLLKIEEENEDVSRD
jgi:copper chaperone CopZ